MDDGLIFFCFWFCGALGLLSCLKSKQQKGNDSIPSLMGRYHKSYFHAYLFQNFWVNGQKFRLEGSLKMMLCYQWETHKYQQSQQQTSQLAYRYDYHSVVTCVVLMKYCLSLFVRKMLKQLLILGKILRTWLSLFVSVYFYWYLHTYKILLLVKTINFLFFLPVLLELQNCVAGCRHPFLFNWRTSKTKLPFYLI